MASFGQLIKEQRIAMGMTQQRLADLVGRSPSTVRSWERDRATPNDETVLVALGAILGIDAVQLGDLAGVELAAASGTRLRPVAGPGTDMPPEEPGQVDVVESELFDSVEFRNDPPVEEEVAAEPAHAATDVDELRIELDRGGPADEPTQILMAESPGPERLLGVATAGRVEFLAEPRPRPLPEPDLDLDPTELIVSVPPSDVDLTAPTPAPTPTIEQPRPPGPDSYLEDPREIRGYRIRAATTTVTLFVMLFVGRWAWAGFREQIGKILDTITTGF